MLHTIRSENNSVMKRTVKQVIFFIITGVVGFGLLGCAGLPTPNSPQDTLLILPVDTDKQTVGTYFGKYRLHIKSRNEGIERIWTITPYGNYAKLTDLPPGSYTIDRVTFSYEKADKKGSEQDIDYRFTLEPGSVTVLPLVFLYDFYRDDTESDRYWMRGRLAEIDREIAERVGADLKRQENFDRWKVSVATKRNDMFESLF